MPWDKLCTVGQYVCHGTSCVLWDNTCVNGMMLRWESVLPTSLILNDTHNDHTNITELEDSEMYGMTLPLAICQFLIWLTGTAGNMLSFIFFSHTDLRASSTGFLFRCLAVFDFIVVQEHFDSIIVLAGTSLLALHTWTCKIFVWLFVSFRIIAVWTLIMIGFERVIAVLWPHQFRTICTIRHGQVMILILVTSVLLLELPQLLSTDVFDASYDGGVKYCYIHFNSSLGQYMQKVDPWIAFILYSALPFICLFLINISIIYGLRRAHNKRVMLNSAPSGHVTVQNSSQLFSMTAMLVCISIAFMVLSLPWCIHGILEHVAGVYSRELRNVSFLLLALNHSINFGLYCLSGRYFRERFTKMLQCNCGSRLLPECLYNRIFTKRIYEVR